VAGSGGVVEGLEGEVVGRAQVAAADLEQRVEGADLPDPNYPGKGGMHLKTIRNRPGEDA
jgi:hypothetical protein